MLIDILSYAISIGCVFAAVGAMTRGGRGWPWRLVALAVLIAVNVVDETMWRCCRMPLDVWIALGFAGKSLVFLVLIFGLSHDSLGRRLFLSIVYSGYAVCFAVAYHLLAYRNVFGLSDVGAAMAGNGAVVILNLAFLFWILPLLPRDDGRISRWGESSLAAGAVAVLLYASGIWPISVITAPARYCAAFAVAAVVAWTVFPILCRLRNERLRTAAAEQSVALLAAEVKVRRTALDEARRIRHDRRHHLIVLGDLLVRGQAKEALEYVSSIDEGADPCASAHVWCANETINAVLAGYARKAAEKGVRFTAEAHVERMLPLPDAELVTVVANLVENAINGVVRRGGSGQRSVRVTLRQRGELFGLTVVNDVPPDFRLARNGLPCTESGVGLESVRQVVDRYSGEWEYTLSGGRLMCELALCGGPKT